MHRPKSMEQAIEDQVRRWQFAHAAVPDAQRLPVIAISRQHGALGGDVARAVARNLGLGFYDREILSRIADEAHLSERVVSPLDERDACSWLSDWIAPLIAEGHLSRFGYLQHLVRVIDDLARKGGAVILGRGAHLVLRQGAALRVKVVAPLAARVAAVAARAGLDPAAARRRVAEVEMERQAFLARCFHSLQEDESSFDLQVNTGVLGVEGAVAVVCAAAAVQAGKQVRASRSAALA